MSPKSSSSVLILRSSVARIAPSAIGISYVCPVRLSVTDRLPVDIGPPPIASGCADRPLDAGGAHRRCPASTLPGTTYPTMTCAGERWGPALTAPHGGRSELDALRERCPN